MDQTANQNRQICRIHISDGKLSGTGNLSSDQGKRITLVVIFASNVNLKQSSPAKTSFPSYFTVGLDGKIDRIPSVASFRLLM